MLQQIKSTFRNKLVYMIAAALLVLAATLPILSRIPTAEAAQGAITKAGSDTSKITSDFEYDFSHTLVSGTNRIVVVSIGSEGNNADTDPQSYTVEYGGVEMESAAVIRESAGPYIFTRIFYLLEANLPANGAKTVEIINKNEAAATSLGLINFAFAAQYNGVKQVAPEATDTHGQTTGATITNDIEPSAGAWVISAVASGNAGHFTHSAPQEEVFDGLLHFNNPNYFEEGDITFTTNGASMAVAELQGAEGDETSVSSTFDQTVNRMVRAAASFVPADVPDTFTYDSPLTGKKVVVEVDENCELETASTTAEGANTSQDVGFDYPNGLVNFTALCDDGHTATVKIFHYGVSKENFVLRKFNPTNNAYFNVDSITEVTIEEQIIDDEVVTVASYSIEDGGPLDIDGEVNGTIVDPVGLASPILGAPNTGLGGRSL